MLPIERQLWLGTAMWGWTVDAAEAFSMLDAWYEAGFRQIDTATNYPINGIAADFRKAESILIQWIRAHQVDDLRVWVKVGSLTNERSPDHNLSEGFILLALEYYRQHFADNLYVLGVHWDNRSNPKEIEATIRALQTVRASGLQVGLSGIRYPEIWAQVNSTYGLSWLIQLKHNLIGSDLARYAPLANEATFVAYGLNAGGLKLDPKAYGAHSSWRVRTGQLDEPHLMREIRKFVTQWNADHPRAHITAFSQLGLCFALHHPRLSGAIIGPSNVQQLRATIQQVRTIMTHDHFAALFVALAQLANNGR